MLCMPFMDKKWNFENIKKLTNDGDTYHVSWLKVTVLIDLNNSNWNINRLLCDYVCACA